MLVFKLALICAAIWLRPSLAQPTPDQFGSAIPRAWDETELAA